MVTLWRQIIPKRTGTIITKFSCVVDMWVRWSMWHSFSDSSRDVGIG